MRLPAHAYPCVFEHCEQYDRFPPGRTPHRVQPGPRATRRDDRPPMKPSHWRRRDPPRIGRDRAPAKRPMAAAPLRVNVPSTTRARAQHS
jgi:hypothetical protein